MKKTVKMVECRACRGYGYFKENGEPTVDRSCLSRGGRKCLDCRGTAEVPEKKEKKKRARG